MRYSEIIEAQQDYIITDLSQLDRALKYGKIELPDSEEFIKIVINEPYSINFPPNFTFYGNTLIEGGIKEITGHFIVLGHLILRHTPLSIFKPILRVYGCLNLESTNVQSLPSPLYIRDDLLIRRTAISFLGDNVKIDGGVIR